MDVASIPEQVTDGVSPPLRSLYDAAEAARHAAYAPYSGFHVGAALKTDDGSIVVAANVENASYGLSMCAERAAVFHAFADGHRSFVAVAVAGEGDSVAPCGACRQVLAEFCKPDTEVVFRRDGVLVAMRLGDLLPHAFGPEHLAPGS